MNVWIVDKDEEVHFVHASGEGCRLEMSPNPQDKAWIFEVKDLGTFVRVMGLNRRWNRLCERCAAQFFDRLEEKK